MRLRVVMMMSAPAIRDGVEETSVVAYSVYVCGMEKVGGGRT